MAQDWGHTSPSLYDSSQVSSRFGNQGIDIEERNRVNKELQRKIGKEHLATRPGPGGKKLTYIESYKAISLANEVFSYNGWSSIIKSLDQEYYEDKAGRFSVAYSAVVKVVLKDGTSHEDIGFGQTENLRDRGKAIENAKKAAISDARKRALRCFGEYLGNSVYDREHIKMVESSKNEVSREYPSSSYNKRPPMHHTSFSSICGASIKKENVSSIATNNSSLSSSSSSFSSLSTTKTSSANDATSNKFMKKCEVPSSMESRSSNTLETLSTVSSSMKPGTFMMNLSKSNPVGSSHGSNPTVVQRNATLPGSNKSNTIFIPPAQTSSLHSTITETAEVAHSYKTPSSRKRPLEVLQESSSVPVDETSTYRCQFQSVRKDSSNEKDQMGVTTKENVRVQYDMELSLSQINSIFD